MSNQVFGSLCSSVKRVWNSGKLIILTSTVVTLSLLGVRQLGVLQPLEMSVYDRMVHLRPDPDPDDRLLIVGITEEDLSDRNEYPLTDATIAQLLQTLEQYQPRAIGLDVIRDVPIGQGRDELIQILEESDRIIGVCKLRDTLSSGFPPPPGLSDEQIGFADLPPDPSGVLRRAFLFTLPNADETATSPTEQTVCNDPDYVLASFAMSLAAQYLAEEGIEPEFTETEELQLGSIHFKPLQPDSGSYQNVDTAGYQVMLNYRSPTHVAPQVTLTEVLKGQVDPALIQDRIVLIGYTAPSVKDEFITPYTGGQHGPMPGVIAHAQIVSQILSAVAGERSLIWYLPQWGEWLWIWVWSLGGGLLAWFIRHPAWLGWAAGAALTSGFGICFIVFTQSGWIPVVPPLLAFVGTVGGVVLIDRFEQAAQTLYKSIKGFLKIDITIDEAKKAEQVAEITDTSYFQQLEQRADALRKQKELAQAEVQPIKTSLEASPSSPSTDFISTDPISEPDYLAQLQQKSKQQRRHRSNAPQFPESRVSKLLTTAQPMPPSPPIPQPPASKTPVTPSSQPAASCKPAPAKPGASKPSQRDRPADPQMIQLHQEFDDYFNQVQKQWTRPPLKEDL